MAALGRPPIHAGRPRAAILRKLRKVKVSIMHWPNQFLLVVLCLGVAAVFIPWFIPRVRRVALIRLVPALAATGCWWAYEVHLHLLARPGDPLIRIDLLVIAPILVIVWLSALASIVVKRPHQPTP